MVGQLVGQPVIVIRGDLEKLGNIVQSHRFLALQHSQNALLHPEEEQHPDDRRFRILELVGEPVSDEGSRQSVGQIGHALHFGRVRHLRNRRDGLDQPVRHGDRIGGRRRLAHESDLVDFLGLGAGGVEDGFGDPHEIAAVAPHGEHALLFFLGEASADP